MLNLSAARRGLTGCLFVVLVLLTTTGCEFEGTISSESAEADDLAPSTAAEAQAVETRDEIEQVLQGLQRQVRGQKRKQVAAHALPGAARRSLLGWYDGLAGLPVADLSLELGNHHESDGLQSEFDADVNVSVKLRGFDQAPVTSTHSYSFVKRASKWRVSEVDRGDTSLSAAPWEMPNSRHVVGERVIVFGDKDNQALLQQWLESADAAAAYVQEAVPYPWSGKALVVLPGSNSVFRDEGFSEVKKLGGAAVPVLGEDEQEWLRVLIPPHSEKIDYEERGELIRHELAHVAINTRDDNSPTWLREGVAEWIAFRKERLYLIGNFADRWYPKGPARAAITDQQFHQGNWARSYATAYFQVLWLTYNKGSDAPWRLINDFRKHRTDSESEHSRRMKKLFGITPDQMAQQANEWMLANTI